MQEILIADQLKDVHLQDMNVAGANGGVNPGREGGRRRHHKK